MRLLSLGLRNYRNYARLELEPGPALNLFLGANGQGKTNLLESVALLALTSSPRTRRESELVGPVAPETRILAQVERGGVESEIKISVRLEGERARRRIEVDGQPRRAVDLPGLCRVTLFWPDDLDLVKSGPEHRRRLLNQMLVQTRAGYARNLSRYSGVIEQRNSLLKRVAVGERPAGELEGWDVQLAELGGELAAARREAVAALAPEAASHHAAISGGERLEMEYVGPPPDLREALEQARGEDLRRGASTVGPHRDDLVLRLQDRDARAYASQGQQRTIVVSIKLAEADVVTRFSGERPILLLDDVLSELDGERRQALLERVGEPGQVIVTSVEAEAFPASVVARALVRCIEEGELRDCG
ncbi:MAG: DNA replication/repair protein RecF [Candidatus Dormibacteraeota bacterium]|nr:DNA replication/repair protein RecF [Candidatus Dormibacteraeota bacterium]